MSGSGIADVREIIERAREEYADDPAAIEMLDACRARAREPLRLAVAGIVKAGKSTLLNALIGERIAPTDAGECTRTVTWYRYAPTARVTLHLVGGSSVPRPVRRTEGRLLLDMGEYTAEEVAWIDVEWPSESLRSTVLIDTPGIASLTQTNSERSARFFLPERSPSEADAIVYLLRHVHAEDLKFLEAFRYTAAGSSQTVNAVAVLSRADELGSGRIDSLLSAAKIAARYRGDGELRSLALDVIPVAGLLAEGGRTLRESEFIALRQIAGMERAARERLLVSADRFVRATDDTTVSADVRRRLLERFGLFGVRLSAAMIRGGATSSSELARRLVQQSGLVELQRFVQDQFRGRASALKSRGILHAVEQVLRERPRPAAAGLLGAIERLEARRHDLSELSLIAELRTAPSALPSTDVADAERILGLSGLSAAARLGVADDADDGMLRARLAGALAHWRELGESPLHDRRTASLCRSIVRSLEGIASEIAPGDTRDPAADIVLARRPA